MSGRRLKIGDRVLKPAGCAAIAGGKYVGPSERIFEAQELPAPSADRGRWALHGIYLDALVFADTCEPIEPPEPLKCIACGCEVWGPKMVNVTAGPLCGAVCFEAFRSVCAAAATNVEDPRRPIIGPGGARCDGSATPARANSDTARSVQYGGERFSFQSIQIEGERGPIEVTTHKPLAELARDWLFAAFNGRHTGETERSLAKLLERVHREALGEAKTGIAPGLAEELRDLRLKKQLFELREASAAALVEERDALKRKTEKLIGEAMDLRRAELAAHAEVGELLRENAMLRRKLEKLERKGGR